MASIEVRFPTRLMKKSTANAYAGRSFVVKIGGRPLIDPAVLDTLAADLAELKGVGVRVVVVHGGGPQLSQLSDRLGLKTRKVNGRRVTDTETLRLAKMVFAGEISTDIVAALRRHGVAGVGLSGVDGGVIHAVRRAPKRMVDKSTGEETVVDFQHVGDIDGVDTAILDLLMNNGFIPVVASLAADQDGQVLNVNADTVAAEVALGLAAEKLFLMSDVPGVLRNVADRTSRIAEMTLADARAFIESGAVVDGMIPKLSSAIRTVEGGVAGIHMMDGHMAHAILDEVCSPGRHGTYIFDPRAPAESRPREG